RGRLGTAWPQQGPNAPLRPTASASVSIALMLLAAKTAAQEGKEVIEAMLVVGLIFLGVIVLGEFTKARRHRRSRRTRRWERRAGRCRARLAEDEDRLAADEGAA